MENRHGNYKIQIKVVFANYKVAISIARTLALKSSETVVVSEGRDGSLPSASGFDISIEASLLAPLPSLNLD